MGEECAVRGRVAALFSGARVAAMSIQNVEAEKTVLGSLLIDGELIKECRLTEQYFSPTPHTSPKTPPSPPY